MDPFAGDGSATSRVPRGEQSCWKAEAQGKIASLIRCDRGGRREIVGFAVPVLARTVCRQLQIWEPRKGGRPRAPVGRHPGPGGSEEETGQIRWRVWQLLRRLCSEQAEPAQFLVRENHLLAAVTFFHVSQTGYTRKAPDIGHGESQQDGCAMLPDLFLDIHAHPEYHSFRSRWEHAVFQTEAKISPLISIEKRPSAVAVAQCAYLLAQIVHDFGCLPRARPIQFVAPISQARRQGKICDRQGRFPNRSAGTEAQCSDESL